MKAALALLLMTVVMVVAETESQGEDFNGEFFQGMETGFFMRDQPQAYKDYDCVPLNVDSEATDTLNKFFVPIEMLLGLLKDEEISQTFKLVQVMVNSVMNLVAAVDDYSGTEFCSGLFFGIHGSNMLLGIAKVFVQKLEKTLEALNGAMGGNQKRVGGMAAESRKK